MSFADAEVEARERLTEALLMLNHIRASSPLELTPLDDLQKAQRGLWLVALYAALERGTNALVDAALAELTSHGTRSRDCAPPLHSIVHFSMVQSLKDCGYDTVFDASVKLFEASMSQSAISIRDNPLAKSLQNVNGRTLIWLAGLFGMPRYEIEQSNLGRLNTLRERRNAVAHGRESASKVGERYGLDEMAKLYDVVDAELTRFRLELQLYCVGKGYLRRAA